MSSLTNVSNRLLSNPFCVAVENNDERVVKQLILQGEPTINRGNEEGKTPLHIAAEKGNTKMVELLRRAGADVNAKTREGRTALHIAAEAGAIKTMSKLIETGSDVNAKTRDKRTALHIAVEAGNREIVGLLLASEKIEKNKVSGADSQHRFLFHTAVQKGNKEIIQQLLASKKIDIDVVDRQGRTPLHIAVKAGNREIIELLLASERVNTNAGNRQGRTPLHIAVEAGNRKIVELLLASERVKTNAGDRQGRTPLHIAVEAGNREKVNIPVFIPKKERMKIIKENVKKNGETKKKIVELLLSINETDINAVDRQGNTPLHLAAVRDKVSLVKKLVEKRASLIRNKEGKLPTEIAKGKAKDYLDVYEARYVASLLNCLSKERGLDLLLGEKIREYITSTSLNFKFTFLNLKQRIKPPSLHLIGV